MKKMSMNFLRTSFKSLAKSLLLLSAVFGLVVAAIFIFAPEKLAVMQKSVMAYGSKGYTLPETNFTLTADIDAKALKTFAKIFPTMAKQVRPALVYIESKKVVELRRNPLEDFFFGFPFNMPQDGQSGRGGRKELQEGVGSGFIVDVKNGYVLTNNHVVQGMSELRAQAFDNRWFKAKVIGSDKETDVAVLKLENFTPQDLKQVGLADSNSIEVGDWVAALGAPFGLRQSFTVGVVSATGRADVISDLSSIEDFIQTDAAINPGNSGGPLLNLEGKVVGINTAIYSRTGSYAGIGFAVPSNIVKTVAESLINNNGKVVRGFVGLGLTEKPTSGEIPENVGGAFVVKVYPNSPAAKAGIKPYDLITSLDGTPVSSQSEFRRKIALSKPGTEVALGILRDGKNITTKMKIGDYETEGKKVFGKEEQKAENNEVTGESPLADFGMQVKELNKDMRKEYKINATNGVIVVAVEQGSPASMVFQEGDVIIEVDRKTVKTEKDLVKAFEALKKKNKDVVFLIERDGVSQLTVLRNR